MYKRKVIAVILLTSFIANAAPQPAVCALNFKCYENCLSHFDDILSNPLDGDYEFKQHNEMLDGAHQIIENCTNGSPDEDTAYAAFILRNIIDMATSGKTKGKKFAKYLDVNDPNNPNISFTDAFLEYNNNSKAFVDDYLSSCPSAKYYSLFEGYLQYTDRSDLFSAQPNTPISQLLSSISFSKLLKTYPVSTVFSIATHILGVCALTFIISTSGLFKRLSNAVSTNILRFKDFCFGTKTEEPQIQDEIDDDIAEDIIKNLGSLSSSVENTKEDTSSITCDPDLAECSGINKQ